MIDENALSSPKIIWNLTPISIALIRSAFLASLLEMNYKNLVKQIADLDWVGANPGDIILLSRCTAREFAESLRQAEKLYPNDEQLIQMIHGELKTDNMTWGDYSERGDHWEFLDHFIKAVKIKPSKKEIEPAMKEYPKAVERFTDEEQAMTVFSREEELTLIFRKIIDSHDWDGLGLGFYKHYLESHILFDSGVKGHHYLTKHFPLHEEILEKFYQIRLNLYAALF